MITLDALRNILDPAMAEILKLAYTPPKTINVLTDIIDPALAELEPHGIRSSPQARAMLYAIGMQESRLQHRFQIITGQFTRGPARGLWQFEAGGGVVGVLSHHSTQDRAQLFARRFVGSISRDAVWASLAYEDTLACIYARLLLWTDPRALPEPTLENEEAAWQYYIRNWRPGKPHRVTWSKFWCEAISKLATV